MMKQYTFHPAPNCHPDRQYAPYNPAAFIPAYTSYNPNNNNSNNKRHSVQNYTGIYNGFANNDQNGGNKTTRPTSYMPPASNGQHYQAYRINTRQPSMTTIPSAPTRPPPPPPPRQSSPSQNPGPAKPKHLRRLSPLVIPASASPPPIFLKPEPPRMPPPQQQQQQQQQYRPYQVQPPPSHTLPHHPRPRPLMRPSPQQRPPPRPASAEIESFLYQNPCMLPPMLPSPTTPLTAADDNRPRYSLPPLPSNAAPQLRRSKASRRASRVVTPRRVSAGPWPLSAEPIVDEAISLVRKFSFEETRSSATEERKALLVDVVPLPLRGGSEGGSTSEEGGSEQEAVTPVDEEEEVGWETPAEYRMQQADALRELLGLVLGDEGAVEGVVGEFGYLGEEGGKGEGVVSFGVVRDEEEREMVARGLGRFSAEAYLAEIDEMKGVFV